MKISVKEFKAPKKEKYTDYCYSNKKHLLSIVAVAYKDGEFYQPAAVYCCGDYSRTVYCTVRFHDTYKDFHYGSGSAGGGGYHKASAALGEALSSAGITLKNDETNKIVDIDGRGDYAMREAITAICKYFGYDEVELVEIGG